MPPSRRGTPEAGARDSVAGLVITERLVATSPGSASGTFESLGAITGTGTVLTGAWVWHACRGTTEPHVVEGSQRLVTAGGELRIDVRLSLRHISGTGVLTGGGSWNVRAAAGEFDGIRAAGTLTASGTLEEHGGSTMELMLTGCVPPAVLRRSAGSTVSTGDTPPAHSGDERGVSAP